MILSGSHDTNEDLLSAFQKLNSLLICRSALGGRLSRGNIVTVLLFDIICIICDMCSGALSYTFTFRNKYDEKSGILSLFIFVLVNRLSLNLKQL